MNRQIQGYVRRVLNILDNLYEQDFLRSMSRDDLVLKTDLEKQHVQQALDLLLAQEWIEETAQGIRHAHVVLTPYGKHEFDRQTGNLRNERIREDLLRELAISCERQPDQPVNSDYLEQRLGLGTNAVCLNLAIMAMHGLVRTEGLSGAGKANFDTYLTPKGKALYANPPVHLLFVSHAALDRKIAYRLREVLEESFPRLSIFVSSAPDVLMVGDPWLDKTLDALDDSRAALVLTTERGLSRHWVWFEAGAAWARKVPIMCGCLGKTRKGGLPPPFILYQAANLDEADDLSALYKGLEEVFGRPVHVPEFAELASEFKLLNSLAEDLHRDQLVPYSSEQKRMVEDKLSGLNKTQREALRMAITLGEISDHYVLTELQRKGFPTNNAVNIFPGLELQTGLVQQVPNSGDGRHNWNLRYRINPEIREMLARLLFERSESAAC